MSIAVPLEASRSVAGTPPRVRTNSPKSTISVRPRTRAAVGVSSELAQPFATTRAARERARVVSRRARRRARAQRSSRNEGEGL